MRAIYILRCKEYNPAMSAVDLEADRALFEAGVRRLKAEGAVDLAERVAENIPGATVIFLSEYRKPPRHNPQVVIAGPIRPGTGFWGETGLVQCDLHIEATRDGGFELGGWVNTWTNPDRTGYTGSRRGGVPFNPQDPHNALARAARNQNLDNLLSGLPSGVDLSLRALPSKPARSTNRRRR